MQEYCQLRYNEEPSLIHPDQIIYAGQSSRRSSFLKALFPNTHLLQVPAGEEPDIPDVIAIAHGKINNVLAQLNGQISHGGRTVILAADTRTSVATLDKTSCPQLVSKGKPKTIEDLRETFSTMAAVTATGMKPQYVVESGSIAHLEGYSGPVNEKRYAEKETCTVELNSEWVKYLASDEGLRYYLSAFVDFYSDNVYRRNLHHITTPSDLSGGLSLPVFVRLGAVDSVAGIPRDSNFLPETLNYMVYVVAVGISPALIEPFDPKIRSNIARWPWLNAVTNLALNK